jgi:curved DNA-binding protein
VKYKDYYAALGVPVDADLAQIKKAYRKLARLHHPDVSKAAGAEERFKEAAEAYATLKDPVKRAAYDELGRRPAGEEFSTPPQWRHDHAEAGAFENADLAELLAALGRRHGGGARGPVPRHGRDYDIVARISLEDAHRGTIVGIDLEDAEGGKTLQVTIPPGVTEGQKLRLRGKGGKGQAGGADGDIYLHMTLAPHAVFRPDGRDLHFELALAPWEAALGTQVEVPTLDGPVTLAVPAGTRSGRKLRLRERGLHNSGGARGHLYATVRIDVPATLTERERDLFAQLAEASDFNPRAAQPKEDDHAPAAA